MGRWLDDLKAREAAQRQAFHPEETSDAIDRLDTIDERDRSPEQEALAAADDPEVQWRVAVIRPQAKPRGPIGRLLARLDTPATDAPRSCGSCGDPLPEGRRFRCAQCVRAVEIVLNELREGVR